ncbi:MAG: SPOR domain-containing protein [Treponema sp.]|jgi:cell division septation protein DedD|nr:SPOR domain-containing protein [Treponema sp.]
MGLIKNSHVAGVLFAAGLLLARGVYAQTPGPGQLGTEIQNLEQKLSAGISPAERHDALVRLAQLRQLSGNIAIAAVNWLDAAAADPNDDAALVSGAFCLAAIGEWEKAALALRPLLASGRQGLSMLQARYLDASLRAWTANDASTLAVLAGDSEFAALRPMIYYTLWQIITRNPGVRGAANAELWKSRLLAEFPQSPEARAVSPEKQKNSPSVSTVQSPLWLLFPGAAGSVSVAPPKPAAPVEPPKSAVSVESPKPAAAVEPPKPAATGNAPSPVVLQTGLFSKEANARAQFDALQKAGFIAAVSRKLVNGAEYWAVTVPGGQNTNKTIQELKKAGFDSFPVK